MAKVLTSDELEHITTSTLNHYETHSEDFWEGTKDHDVTQNYQALLGALPQRKPLRILDFGCGPGRDLIYFKGLGHEATGLDGSAAFCAMAQLHSGCPVLHQNFLSLKLSKNYYDGIFANASLFHVPEQELLQVLKNLNEALQEGGILFSSNPRGQGEGWSGSRYSAYFEWAPYQVILKSAGFEPLMHYYRPKNLPCSEQPWLASVSRKI